MSYVNETIDFITPVNDKEEEKYMLEQVKTQQDVDDKYFLIPTITELSNYLLSEGNPHVNLYPVICDNAPVIVFQVSVDDTEFIIDFYRPFSDKEDKHEVGKFKTIEQTFSGVQELKKCLHRIYDKLILYPDLDCLLFCLRSRKNIVLNDGIIAIIKSLLANSLGKCNIENLMKYAFEYQQIKHYEQETLVLANFWMNKTKLIPQEALLSVIETIRSIDLKKEGFRLA